MPSLHQLQFASSWGKFGRRSCIFDHIIFPNKPEKLHKLVYFLFHTYHNLASSFELHRWLNELKQSYS
jgi:hypothetical protein